MPVGGEAIRFGPVGDVLSRVVVPWVRTTEERRCAIVSGISISLFSFLLSPLPFFFFFFPSAFRGFCVGWVLRVWIDDGDEGMKGMKKDKERRPRSQTASMNEERVTAS